MGFSKNKKNNKLKKRNKNYNMKLFLKFMNKGNIDILKTSIININNYHSEKIDIPLKIYKNGFLTLKRLDFIIKNCSDILYISSSLIRELIKNNEIQLLRIIFENFKFYDNDFIKMLLYQYKNKTSTSVTNLNGIISNKQYRISSNYSIKNFQDYFVSVCEYGKVNVVKYLNDYGADVNKKSSNNMTPLYCACEKGNEKVVKFLIEHGADVNKENKYNETPLYCACRNGNEKIVKYLIDRGADIKIVDILGYSPLFMACESGNENLVKYLIELGADINEESHCGNTPLFYACESGNENLVKYLVEEGADLKKINSEGETPLFKACRSRNENLVKYLVEHGIDIAKEDTRGETALYIACWLGNEKMVKYLIKQGADIYKVIDVINSSEYDLPYIGMGLYGLTYKKEKIINYLIELKDNINIENYPFFNIIF